MLPLPPAEEANYEWDEQEQQYRDTRTGELVAVAVILLLLRRIEEQTTLQITLLSEAYRNGEIPLAEWELGMVQKIKEGTIAAALLANGGAANMTGADWQTVQERIDEQVWRFLAGFAALLAAGKIILDGRFVARAKLYGLSVGGAFWDIQVLKAVLKGLTQSRRHLGQAEHCVDCVRYADMGWQPIGVLPPPKVDSACRSNCKCSMEFR
jgi:hypothetical protein